MIFVSDVHGAAHALEKVFSLGQQVVILGDLVNLTDYRSGDGAIADVLGADFARASAAARASGDFARMRSLWEARSGDQADELRREIADALSLQYEDMAKALGNGSGYAIHGNVDRPVRLQETLPESIRYVHGEVVEIEGLAVGLIGGGIQTPMAVEGEVTDEEMTQLLEGLGRVDVLGTHVPPAVRPLRNDVITGREERGSAPLYDYIVEYQPRFHFFGDVHQAQATTWRIGATRCHNAGYFRATGRYLSLVDAMVQLSRVG